jgi:hypothetical protein
MIGQSQIRVKEISGACQEAAGEECDGGNDRSGAEKRQTGG